MDKVIKFKPGVLVFFKRNGDVLIRAEQDYCIRGGSEEVLSLIKNLRNGISNPTSEMQFALKKFENMGLLTSVIQNPYSSTKLEKVYSYLITANEDRDSQSAIAKLENLQMKRVCILGCGGTGANIAQLLLAVGVKNFLLIDADRVQDSNLNRQLPFKRCDVGRQKTEALKDYLCERDADVNVDTKDFWVQSNLDVDQLLVGEDVDFLVCCADQPPLLIQLWVTLASLRLNIPVHFGGVGLTNGSWGPLLHTPQLKEAYKCYLENVMRNYHAESFEVVSGSVSTTNMIIASIIAHDIFSFLSGHRPDSWGKRMRIKFPSLCVEEALAL